MDGSPPLSVHMVFTFYLLTFLPWLSTQGISWTPDVCSLEHTYTHTNRVLSSMKVRKYSAPPSDFVFIFPQTSLWTKPRGSSDRLPLLLGNWLRWCFPRAQGSQKRISFDMSVKKPTTGSFFASFCKFCSSRCPRRRCQISSFVSRHWLSATLTCCE